MTMSIHERAGLFLVVREHLQSSYQQAHRQLHDQWSQIEDREDQDAFVSALIEELLLAHGLCNHLQQGADTCS